MARKASSAKPAGSFSVFLLASVGLMLGLIFLVSVAGSIVISQDDGTDAKPINRPRYTPPLEAPPDMTYTPPEKSEAEQHLDAAQAAYDAGNFRQAIVLARAAEVQKPSDANLIIGSAACGAKDLNLANTAYRFVAADSQKALIANCESKGIKFQAGKFKPGRKR